MIVIYPGLLIAGLIQVYRVLLSPLKRALLGPLAACRFTPTCSQYSYECFCQFGFWRGSYYSIRRLLRCHPFHPGGEDPIPHLSNKQK
jgi:uncharacterized protein